jgi:hypothetical protein
MSIIRSSVINLFNGTGEHTFQTKVSSDRVELQTDTIPLNLRGTSISLTNQGGETITDVVSVVKDILTQLTLMNTRITNLQINDVAITTLIENIQITPAPIIYKLAAMVGSYNVIIRITANDKELSTEELTALIGQHFTYRDLSNTAIVKFTGVHDPSQGLYLDIEMKNVPVGTRLFFITPVEITGDRDPDYVMSAVEDTKIRITFVDGTELTARERDELLGRTFTYGTYNSDVRLRFQINDASGLFYLNGYVTAEIGTNIFLV